MTSHDHNFKNVFLDFPKEALEWLLPDVPKELGKIQQISFVRGETGRSHSAGVYGTVSTGSTDAV